MLENGIYEQLISQKLRIELDELLDHLYSTVPLDKAEAPKILAQYAASIIQKKLEIASEHTSDTGSMIQFINTLVSSLPEQGLGKEIIAELLDSKAEQLLEIISKKNKITQGVNVLYTIRPQTSLTQSSLFTGAAHEPSLFSELKKEISSCNRIDMLVSFIKWSGLRLIIEELRAFTQNGGHLKVITTSYMGATDIKAIEELNALENTEIKISYDTKRTRLHAKTYVFYRSTGYSTAYIGSSNLSNAALSSGLEWNLKITAKDQPETMQKIEATFESYWNTAEFEAFNFTQKERLAIALKAEKYFENSNASYIFEIRPYVYQQDILNKLSAERTVHQQFRNLIVAATGTGKTVIAAFDYKRFCNENKGSTNKLLFVAHREEILKQSLYCYRGVLRDANFGELFVGGYKPTQTAHLFMSIQTFNAQNWTEQTSSDYYDYIVIDEFHHAAAPYYNKILSYYDPKILLGLTATPERMDGEDILHYFNYRIAAQIRLPEAIDRKLLCPFQYFGVSDNIDLSMLKWTRGGYDKNELSNVYTLNQKIADSRCETIIKALYKYLTDIQEAKGLGFCVSIDHAVYMANSFNVNGINSVALTAKTTKEARDIAKSALQKGEIKFLFVVDLYNEGVDIPEINTVLFLRPTDSLTVFLQQLGRGLRLSDNKECLTVLDFIGQAHQKYNFEQKFLALQADSVESIQSAIKKGFPSVPSGCFIQLEKLASEYVLSNIKVAFGKEASFITKIKSFEEDTGLKLSLSAFLDYYHLDGCQIYTKYNFSRLCVKAGVIPDYEFPDELLLTKAFVRICFIDSSKWIQFILELMENVEEMNLSQLPLIKQRMARMLQFTIWPNSPANATLSDLKAELITIKTCTPLFKEFIDLLTYQFEKIDFVDMGNPVSVDCPLDVYCSYTRDQILVAMDFLNPSTVREGVKYLPALKTDLLFTTLNKSDKDYSPTTMYNDYSINESLFHWQSQNATSESSPTGQRYIHHKKSGYGIWLFVREFKKDKNVTAPYLFMGSANYIQHEGSSPMSIIWHLDNPIPARFMRKTNKLMLG